MSKMIVPKKWAIQRPNPQMQVSLSNSLGVHPIISQLLVNRGITDPAEAETFLNADRTRLHDPFLLKDMDKAVARIRAAKDKSETVLVFGDYDVDGVTSSAIMNIALKKMGIHVINHIPHRIHDGYGLNHEICAFAQEQKIGLLITVDCGITAHQEIESLNRAGVDVIVVDHHVASVGPLPPAVAIVNPKRKDCTYPYENLAAVGLVMKLVHALEGKLDDDVLDLVALGTIADVVELRGENRIFVKEGLPLIARTKNLGLRALMEVAKVNTARISPFYVGFILGPRINAMGRMASADTSLRLLLSTDPSEAMLLAKEMEDNNKKRQKIQRTIVDEAVDVIEQEVNFNHERVIVVGREGWHKGVLGIVASRLAEMYSRPAVVISFEDGVGTASARSIEGFHLYNALSSCAETLDQFGGHKLAAGLTLKMENLELFKEKINTFALRTFEIERLSPAITIDSEIPISQLNLKLVDIIESMEPFGEGNPAPVFCSRRLMVKSTPVVMGKDTIKFWVTDGKASISAIGFGMAKYKSLVRLGQPIDIAYQMIIDDWKKAPTVQLKLKDIRPSI